MDGVCGGLYNWFPVLNQHFPCTGFGGFPVAFPTPRNLAMLKMMCIVRMWPGRLSFCVPDPNQAAGQEGCWPLKPWLGSAFNLFWGFKLSQWKAKPLRAGSGADKGISVRAPSQLCALSAADFRGVGRLSENTINSNCTILIVLFQAFPGISDLSTATNLDLSLGNSSETWRVFSESN